MAIKPSEFVFVLPIFALFRCSITSVKMEFVIKRYLLNQERRDDGFYRRESTKNGSNHHFFIYRKYLMKRVSRQFFLSFLFYNSSLLESIVLVAIHSRIQSLTTLRFL